MDYKRGNGQKIISVYIFIYEYIFRFTDKTNCIYDKRFTVYRIITLETSNNSKKNTNLKSLFYLFLKSKNTA